MKFDSLPKKVEDKLFEDPFAEKLINNSQHNDADTWLCYKFQHCFLDTLKAALSEFQESLKLPSNICICLCMPPFYFKHLSPQQNHLRWPFGWSTCRTTRPAEQSKSKRRDTESSCQGGVPRRCRASRVGFRASQRPASTAGWRCAACGA